MNLSEMDVEGTDYWIMPTTYYPEIEGRFILAVTADQEFTLKPQN